MPGHEAGREASKAEAFARQQHLKMLHDFAGIEEEETVQLVEPKNNIGKKRISLDPSWLTQICQEIGEADVFEEAYELPMIRFRKHVVLKQNDCIFFDPEAMPMVETDDMFWIAKINQIIGLRPSRKIVIEVTSSPLNLVLIFRC